MCSGAGTREQERSEGSWIPPLVAGPARPCSERKVSTWTATPLDSPSGLGQGNPWEYRDCVAKGNQVPGERERKTQRGVTRRPGAMDLIIPDDILQATRMTAEELRQEIAVLLFPREKLTLGQASRLAEMSRLQFQHLLASRQVPVHYDVAEFEEDLRTLGGLG